LLQWGVAIALGLMGLTPRPGMNVLFKIPVNIGPYWTYRRISDISAGKIKSARKKNEPNYFIFFFF
jgi:hypothetical protein